MGHYCYFCNEKLSGGYRPTCCDEIECICNSCLNDYLSDRMDEDLSFYIMKTIKMNKTCTKATIKVTAELLDWLEGKKPVCPKCEAEWTEHSFEDY